MGKAHHNSKLADEDWVVLFGRWHAGESLAKLREEAGVSKDTWTSNAERLRMRRKDLPEGHPGRRAVPYHLRPDDFRDPRSKLCEGDWRAANARRMAGEAMPAIAADLPISENALGIGLRRRFGKKKDHKGAVVRRRGRAAAPVLPRDAEMRAACAFTVVKDDREATRANVEAALARAAAAGQAEAVEFLNRVLASFSREAVARMREEALLAKQETGGAEPAALPARRETPVKLHDHQRPPASAEDGGDWTTWLVLGGRGAGKTLAGASWVAEVAEELGEGGRVALIGATLHDVREVMIEGPSGLMALDRWWEKRKWPKYEPSRRRLKFPSGAWGYAFSAEDADGLRGPQFHAGWADEFCAWGSDGALAMVRLGLRLGAAPRLCVTTTPRPTRALKALMAEPRVAVSRAGTAANAKHLSEGFVAGLEALYGGTRLAAQEIDGQVVDDGRSLWTAGMIAACKAAPPFADEGSRKWASDAGGYRASRCLSPQTPDFDRVVVGVDPTATADGAACGIVVVGRHRRPDGRDVAHVMADWTVRGETPEGWSRRVAEAAEVYGAHEVVAEVNQGGDMVRSVLGTQARLGAPLTTVRATRGKAARAEPVAALYEQGRVKHSGAGLERLEEELMALGVEADGASFAKESFDRADALVWAVTALMVDGGGARGAPAIRGL